MNILICARDFVPEVGGIQTVVRLLAEGLAERLSTRDDSQRDGSLRDNRASAPEGRAGVTVLTRTPAGGFDDSTLPYRVVRRWDARATWRWLGWADVVHLASPVLMPLALSLVRQKPVVIEHHLYEAVCPGGFLFYEPTGAACPGHFMQRGYRECLRCNAVVVGWRRSVQKLLLAFPRRWLCGRAAANLGVTDHVSRRIALPRTLTLYHGIPTPATSSPTGSEHAARALTFAYVGRLVTEKGLELLVEAAQQLRELGYEFRLLFIGDGPQRARLEAITRELALEEHVTFTGFLTGQAFERALAGVSAVVMPSLWEETAGLAAMEHMMRGRLVVAADIGGLGELVADTGLKFTAGSREDLVRCLRQVLEDPTIVAQLGQTAQERARRLFAHRRMVDDHLAIYDKLVEQSTRSGVTHHEREHDCARSE